MTPVTGVEALAGPEHPDAPPDVAAAVAAAVEAALSLHAPDRGQPGGVTWTRRWRFSGRERPTWRREGPAARGGRTPRP